MHAFSPAAARATAQSAGTAGDDRVAAAERAAAMPFPTPAEEIWRYSRIGELDLERFRPGVATTTVEGGDGLVSVGAATDGSRSEEHTSELQSHSDLVCRLLLE